LASKAESSLVPVAENTMLYSVVIPAHNEEKNIVPTVRSLAQELRAAGVPFEVLVVNDNSMDNTAQIVEESKHEFPEIRLVHNLLPAGMGRAIRCGLCHIKGDAIAIVMSDLSDSPKDVLACYRKLEEGYDCAFGSRFTRGSKVTAYPKAKRIANRIANKIIQVMYLTRHNDMTNAFKVYRRHVIESISPLLGAHFNITIEMSLSALIRGYSIATLPIDWSGRTWGSSSLRLRDMGRRYLCTLLKIWFEKMLICDDLIAEKKRPQ